MDNSLYYEIFAEALARGANPSDYLKDVSFFEGWSEEEIKNLGLDMLGMVSWFRVHERDLMLNFKKNYSSDFKLLGHDMSGICSGDKFMLPKCTGYRKHLEKFGGKYKEYLK